MPEVSASNRHRLRSIEPRVDVGHDAPRRIANTGPEIGRALSDDHAGVVAAVERKQVALHLADANLTIAGHADSKRRALL